MSRKSGTNLKQLFEEAQICVQAGQRSVEVLYGHDLLDESDERPEGVDLSRRHVGCVCALCCGDTCWTASDCLTATRTLCDICSLLRPVQHQQEQCRYAV